MVMTYCYDLFIGNVKLGKIVKMGKTGAFRKVFYFWPARDPKRFFIGHWVEKNGEKIGFSVFVVKIC